MDFSFGARQAVQSCVHVQPGDRVVIIHDEESQGVADALFDACVAVTDVVRSFLMEDFGVRPEDGSVPLLFPEELAEALSGCEVSFYAARGRKGELESFRRPMLEAVEANPRLRHAHMPNITPQIMGDGMAVDYHAVQALSKRVYDIVSVAGKVRVTTPAGSDFTVRFSPELKWLVADADIRPGKWSNLPDGEVFTCAHDVNGRIVIDGVLGDYFGRKYGLLQHPVTLEVKDARVQSIKCDDSELLSELEEYSKQDENANRIGEFAIGTNIGLKELIGNLLQDEKFPGVHVALGHGYPAATDATWSSKAHCDGVMKECTVEVDGEVIMRDGKFLI